MHSKEQIYEVEVDNYGIIQYLVFDQDKLPLPNSYDMELSSIEATPAEKPRREQPSVISYAPVW